MMPAREALRKVVDGIEEAFSRFPDMWNAEAQIAFSGGKDSIALAYALGATGRPVRLRAIDMGYSRQWRDRIQNIADALSLPVEIVRVSALVEDTKVDPEVRHDLGVRRAFLDRLEATDPT